MKIKTIIIWVLLITLLVCATIEEIFINSSLEKIKEQATNLKYKLQNSQIDESIKNDLENLSEEWEHIEFNLCFLNNHNDLKEIGDALRYATNYLKSDKKEEALEKIDVVIFYAESYKHLLSFNIQNVF